MALPMHMKLRVIALTTIALSIASSCDDSGGVNPIPYVFVHEDIYLKDLRYQALQQTGGHIYFDDAGFRGLIIYNDGSGYRAFDRACTFDPRSECTPIEVDASTLFMVHSCCGSVFGFDGEPTSGPATFRLMEYTTFIEGDFLLVRSDF